jgi:hypothetical protein
MATVELRPMSLGELLDRTFSIYRSHFWLFVAIMAMPSAFSIPVNVLFLSLQGSFMSSLGTVPGQPPVLPTPGLIVGTLVGCSVFLVVFMTVYSIAVAAAVSAVSDVYLGRSSTVRGSYGRIRGRFGRLMGVVSLIFVRVVGVAFAVLVIAVGGIAGIAVLGGRSNVVVATLVIVLSLFAYLAALVFCVYFALRYVVSIPILMLENLGVRDTIRRSVHLTRGRRGQIFLTLLIAAIIGYVGAIVFQLPWILATMAATMRGHWTPWLAFAYSVSAAVGGSLTGPISMIAIVLLYYDARIRKEAFDLQFMMASIDNPPPAPAGAVSPA